MTVPRLTSHVSRFTLFILLLQFTAPASAQSRADATGITTRVSVASDGTEGNSVSWHPSISASGLYVAFDSESSNLVTSDTNGRPDVFVHDRQTAQTTRVSVASDGTQGNDSSELRSISASGRYVAFDSLASNLVSGDTNTERDIFVHDRQTGQTTRNSVASDGTQGNNQSEDPAISATGRYVAFWSFARNLVSGDTNGFVDVFVHDRQTGQTSRVSVASDGMQANSASFYYPSISSSGRYVAFQSDASNLVNGDTNECYPYEDGHCPDIFVHDLATGQTIRISVNSNGRQGNGLSEAPSISASGRDVAFDSFADNLLSGDTNGAWDVFVHNQQAGGITRVSVASDGTEGNDGSFYPSISASGRHVAFLSCASNLVSGDTNGFCDVFVHERLGVGP